jgi:probable addiction module antidote protein
MVKIKPFDTAQHLDNPEVIAGYLTEAFQSADEKLILRAITNVARAQGMSKVARKVGMSRTSLYWQDTTKPEFTTVLKVLAAVGVRLQPKRTVDPDDAPADAGDDDDAVRMPAGVLMGRRLKVYHKSGPGPFRAMKAKAKHRLARKKK